MKRVNYPTMRNHRSTLLVKFSIVVSPSVMAERKLSALVSQLMRAVGGLTLRIARGRICLMFQSASILDAGWCSEFVDVIAVKNLQQGRFVVRNKRNRAHFLTRLTRFQPMRSKA